MFSIYSRYQVPLQKVVALHLNKFESPSPKNVSHQVWLKLAKRLWRRWFLNVVNVFLLISPLGKECTCGPSFDHTWISFTQRYFVPMLIKLAKSLWRRFDYFSLFCGYLPFEKDIAFNSNKPEFPFTEEALCQVFLKLV